MSYARRWCSGKNPSNGLSCPLPLRSDAVGAGQGPPWRQHWVKWHLPKVDTLRMLPEPGSIPCKLTQYLPSTRLQGGWGHRGVLEARGRDLHRARIRGPRPGVRPDSQLRRALGLETTARGFEFSGHFKGLWFQWSVVGVCVLFLGCGDGGSGCWVRPGPCVGPDSQLHGALGSLVVG